MITFLGWGRNIWKAIMMIGDHELEEIVCSSTTARCPSRPTSCNDLVSAFSLDFVLPGALTVELGHR